LLLLRHRLCQMTSRKRRQDWELKLSCCATAQIEAG
jgi:hypothetical protein